MKFGIAAKVNFMTTAIILFASLILGIYFIRHETRALNYELDERAHLLVHNLSVNLEYPILRGDKKTIIRLMDNVLVQKDVVFALVESVNGDIIYQKGDRTDKKERLYNAPVIARVLTTSIGANSRIGNQAPEEKKLANVSVGISLSVLFQKQSDVVRTVLMEVVIAIIVASLCSFFIFEFVLIRPISLLLEGTRQIAKGDLTHKVPVETDDEIGTLATAFNEMVEDLRKSRDELQKYSQQLEQHVTDRTKDLQQAYNKLQTTEEQLIQSEKMASVGTLAGGVAHEINNPLTTVLGYSQVLLSEMNSDDPLRMNAVEIEKSAVRCKKIIENLLRFSRQQKFSFELVDIAQLVEDTLILIGNQLKNNNVKIEKDLPRSIPTIIGNPQQLQQVFINIMINAFDAMPNGGTLKISACQDKDFVQVDFADTGSGIPADLIDKVFDPFLTTKPPGKGTGLGLSVSYGIIQKHNGRINVKSEVGKGSVFSVFLPLPENPKTS